MQVDCCWLVVVCCVMFAVVCGSLCVVSCLHVVWLVCVRPCVLLVG